MLERGLAGLTIAAGVAWIAWRANSLTARGALTATAVGALATAAGWEWAALLLVFFVSSSVLTRWKSALKAQRAGGVVEKGGARDATQVLANGALYAVAVAAGTWQGNTMFHWFGLGVLATVTSDTWGTEVGVALGREPRLLLTSRRVAAGTSGAVSAVGSVASAAGAALIATAARVLGVPGVAAAAAALGGLAGAFADTVLGASLQERRRCVPCNAATERLVHTCGHATVAVGGIRGFRNDLVNLASGALGGVVAVVVGFALG